MSSALKAEGPNFVTAIVEEQIEETSQKYVVILIHQYVDPSINF